MTQARKSREHEDATAPVDPIPTPPATFFLTTEQATKLGLNPTTAKDQLADANAVYTQIKGESMPTRDTLVQWATGAWGSKPVDRLNAALGLLQRMNLVYQIN